MSTKAACHECGCESIREIELLTEIADRKRNSTYSFAALTSECTQCGAQFETHDQGLQNDERVRVAKFLAQDCPPPAEITALRDKWAITRKEAGELFGGGEIAFYKYESGEVVPSQAMGKLIKLAIYGVLDKSALVALKNNDVKTLISRSTRQHVFSSRLFHSGLKIAEGDVYSRSIDLIAHTRLLNSYSLDVEPAMVPFTMLETAQEESVITNTCLKESATK